MADFAKIINRLAVVRDYITDAIIDKGGSVGSATTFAELSNCIYNIPTGMEHVRNGYQLFKENAELSEIPTTLNFTHFDSMYQMCYKCTSLTRVPQLPTSTVENMMWAFYGCTSLVEIDGLDTRSITSASELFHGCSALTAIYSALDFSNVTSKIDTTFTTCRSLVEVRFTGTINVDIAMNGCSKLSVDSLLSLLNALCENGSGKTCKIGSTNLGKLTDAQKAIATNKGWELV